MDGLPDLIYGGLGGGALAAIVLALIQWAREKPQDRSNVAKNWEAGISTLLRSAESRVAQLDEDLLASRQEATEMRKDIKRVREELSRCTTQVNQLSMLVSDVITELDHKGADTQPYRNRLRAIK